MSSSRSGHVGQDTHTVLICLAVLDCAMLSALLLGLASQLVLQVASQSCLRAHGVIPTAEVWV